MKHQGLTLSDPTCIIFFSIFVTTDDVHLTRFLEFPPLNCSNIKLASEREDEFHAIFQNLSFTKVAVLVAGDLKLSKKICRVS